MPKFSNTYRAYSLEDSRMPTNTPQVDPRVLVLISIGALFAFFLCLAMLQYSDGNEARRRKREEHLVSKLKTREQNLAGRYAKILKRLFSDPRFWHVKEPRGSENTLTVLVGDYKSRALFSRAFVRIYFNLLKDDPPILIEIWMDPNTPKEMLIWRREVRSLTDAEIQRSVQEMMYPLQRLYPENNKLFGRD